MDGRKITPNGGLSDPHGVVMKCSRLVTLLAAFVFAASATVAFAATTNGFGANHNATAVHTLTTGTIAGSTATYLFAGFQPAKDKNDKDKDRGGDKDKFHGAEMGSTAIVIAGLLAISAYFLFVRRKSHTRA
jgi:membrane protein YqaA with SNARE-associated domain